ncbi:hypothetical protein [Providencia stuartii]|uniref:hypothetical protein n=1 Tax=Providencia stuartii TaxID=588 RepID=UPI001EF97ABA|nr:hypothetical protein [Providencia stuartii]
MTGHNHIDPHYLDQIFPENNLTTAQKHDALLYAMGSSIAELARLNNRHKSIIFTTG